MPELPEVETIRRDLSVSLARRSVRKIEVLGRSSVVGVPETFHHRLSGAVFMQCGRRGKLLLFGMRLKGGEKATLAVHLRMTGQLIHAPVSVFRRGASQCALTSKLTRVIIHLDDGSILLFNDQRRFGRLEVLDASGLVKTLSKFGPEPLDPAFTPEVLAPILKRRKALKAVLLDQGAIAGIGNIYADEILFRAGLKPQHKAMALQGEKVVRLHRAILQVLEEAVDFRGTSFSDYRDGKGEKGGFEKRLNVYGREGQPCRVCEAAIQLTTCAGRATRWCKKCQKSR